MELKKWHNVKMRRKTRAAVDVEQTLLRYLGQEKAKLAMGKVYEGYCGVHQDGIKMRWLLRYKGI